MSFYTNVDGFGAVVQMTNAGIRSITFLSDFYGPVYDRLIHTGDGWEDSGFVGGDGFSVRARTLQAGQSMGFIATIQSGEPCRIRVSYRFSCLPTCVERYLPTWLLQRFPRLRTRTVISPVIRLDAKLLLLARGN